MNRCIDSRCAALRGVTERGGVCRFGGHREQVARVAPRGYDEAVHGSVVEEVGADAARYKFVTRAADSHMEFDIELAKRKSAENPVYYVQYAHARIAGILTPAAERGIGFEDGDVGNVMDRALQLELDRQSWEAAETTRADLEMTVDGLDIGFIPPETLRDWQRWVLGVFDGGFSWERLRFMARRISRGDEAHAAHVLAREFIEAVTENRGQLYQVVPRRKLVDFQERAVAVLVRTVGDYLP